MISLSQAALNPCRVLAWGCQVAHGIWIHPLVVFYVPQGVSADLIATRYGFSRDDVMLILLKARNVLHILGQRIFYKVCYSVKDQNGLTILDYDEHMRPETDMQSLASLNPSFVMPGEMGGFNAVAIYAHPEVETINHVHHGNSSGIVDGAAAVLLGSKKAGKTMQLQPRARIRLF